MARVNEAVSCGRNGPNGEVSRRFRNEGESGPQGSARQGWIHQARAHAKAWRALPGLVAALALAFPLSAQVTYNPNCPGGGISVGTATDRQTTTTDNSGGDVRHAIFCLDPSTGKLYATNYFIGPGSGPGSGTVTTFSVTSASLSPLFTASVATPTTTPEVSFALISQSQNLFYGSPNGSTGVPGFRSIVAADLPSGTPTGISLTNQRVVCSTGGSGLTNCNASDNGSTFKIFEYVDAQTSGYAIEIPNDGTTGTTLAQFAKLTTASPAAAIVTTTTDGTAGGAIGICVAACGTTGNAIILIEGETSLAIDGATTSADYVICCSTTTTGNGHDAGAAYPVTGEVIARVLSTNGGAGSYAVFVNGPDVNPTNAGVGGGNGPFVRSVTGTAPVVSSGGKNPAISCPTCVTSVTGTAPVASSGGTTPAISITANGIANAQLAVVQTRRVCAMIFGADNAGAALANADLAPQGRQCFIPYAATVIEVTVSADAGTPNVVVAKNHAGTVTDLTSTALATAASGGIACSNTGGTTGLDGVTTCSGTLTTTALAIGDYLQTDTATAGGTAKRMSIFVTFTVN